MTDNSLRDAAVGFARAGFCVFPLAPGGKIPVAGSHGELDGSDDTASVEAIWRCEPNANIGLALRYHSGLFVLDVDARNGGLEWLKKRPSLPKTITASTPSLGSSHYWFRTTEPLLGCKTRGLDDEDGAKVDIKGLPYGFVVLPPSRTDKGCYRWLLPPQDTELALCPEWLESEIWHSCKARRIAQWRPCSGPMLGKRSLVIEMRDAGLLGEQIRPGVWLCRCPNETNHSEKRRPFGGDTLVFDPTHPGGRGWLYCAHAHCQDIMSTL